MKIQMNLPVQFLQLSSSWLRSCSKKEHFFSLMLPVFLESYSHTHEAEKLRDGMQSEVFIHVAHAPTDNISGATHELQVCYQKIRHST